MGEAFVSFCQRPAPPHKKPFRIAFGSVLLPDQLVINSTLAYPLRLRNPLPENICVERKIMVAWYNELQRRVDIGSQGHSPLRRRDAYLHPRQWGTPENVCEPLHAVSLGGGSHLGLPVPTQRRPPLRHRGGNGHSSHPWSSSRDIRHGRRESPSVVPRSLRCRRESEAQGPLLRPHS